jgi:adenylosuccinate lyase
MLDLMIKLVRNLLIYPENMMKNLYLTRGLVFSQTVLLKLVDKGLSREDAYRIVQSSAMDVWANKEKFLKDELLKSKELMSYISQIELEEIFNSDKILKNVDYIFQRSIYSEE